MGAAWKRNAMCESAFSVVLQAVILPAGSMPADVVLRVYLHVCVIRAVWSPVYLS